MNIVFRLTAAAAAATLVIAAPASAQITFSGYTNGCFYTAGDLACTPETTPGVRTDVVGPLTYTNSTFTVSSFGGVAAIGETAATPNFNNLGSISLPAGATGINFSNQRFVLNVFFTSPAGVSPTSTTYMATLAGSVSDNSGAVDFDFDNSTRNFTFNGGTFAFRVNDVSLTNTGGMNTTGMSGFINVTQTSVAEPSTYLLMASGLAGLAFFGKRRRNNAV